MYGIKDIPNVGTVELSWHNTPNNNNDVSASATAKQASVDGDVGMGGTNAGEEEAKREVPPVVEDYDVAEEDYDVADDIS